MNAAAADRRITPATDRVALESLRGTVTRAAYTPGRPMRLVVPVADLCHAPQGPRDRQVIFGADLTVIDHQGDWSFVQAAADGYCGWLRSDGLGDAQPAITHRIGAPASHIYAEPSLKSPDLMALSLGARLSVMAVQDGFARLTHGGWVPVQHLSEQPATDPASVAQTLLGTAYLWGGNSRSGIDCSGLVQAALTACAAPCPGDSDMQERAFPAATGPFQRNDLLFWPGHVAMALDAALMIHATAYAMSVIIEPIEQALARIDAAGHGPFRGARRPALVAVAQFP